MLTRPSVATIIPIVVTFRWSPGTEELLLLAANRDEFYESGPPSACAQFGGLGDKVLAGRDLRSGGAWLGVTWHGRFAMVTNIRNPALAAAKRTVARELVKRFLKAPGRKPSFAATLAIANNYEGFNLLCGELAGSAPSLWFANSQEHGAGDRSGHPWFSNASLDTH